MDAQGRMDTRAVGTPPAGHLDTIRNLGLGLTACTLPWVVSNVLFGPHGDGPGSRINDLTALLFQIGLFALVTAQLRTRATGTSRASVTLLRVETVLLVPACLWSLLHGILPVEARGATWLAVLDVFWPLSMLGMFTIGVKLAFAGRWRGVLRWWPLVAESWAFVAIPSLWLLGEPVGRWIGAGHLVVGYATLGLLLARSPELTVAPRERG